MNALPAGWSERFVDGAGARIHLVEAGSGPPLILLHGFPEFWYGWRDQIGAFAAAGFHVIAPDLRGYNLSGKPSGLDAYTVSAVAADVLTLVPHAEKFYLAGHDWGGIMAWVVAMSFPGRVERLAVLNAPHPSSVRAAARKPAQMLRFWYQFFFQLPWLPELVLRAGEFRMLRGTLRGQTKRVSAFPRAVLDEYVAAWSQPDALTSMLNYYRAAFRRSPGTPRGAARTVDLPVLLIWGQRDPFFTPQAMERSHEWASNLRIEKLPEAGHFVQTDDPERVNELILSFFRE